MLRGGFNVWPDLLQFLTSNLDQHDANSGSEIIEISIHTIAIIVEDCTKLFEDNKFRNVVEQMFPPICKLIQPSFNEQIVQNAINTINMLLLTNTDTVLENMDGYLS